MQKHNLLIITSSVIIIPFFQMYKIQNLVLVEIMTLGPFLYILINMNVCKGERL